MWGKRTFAVLSFIASLPVGLASGPVMAQTFSCSQATNCTEAVICSTPQLGKLDEQMSALYFELQDQSSRRGARALLQSQRTWLARRDACGCNANCLVDRYSQRIRQFQDILN